MSLSVGERCALFACTCPINNVLSGHGGMALHSPKYSLIPADLRDPPSATLLPLLESGVLKRSIPTLFISECVFVYMEPSKSDAIVKWFGENFDIAGGIVYEMFGLNDAFGKVMRANLTVSS